MRCLPDLDAGFVFRDDGIMVTPGRASSQNGERPFTVVSNRGGLPQFYKAATNCNSHVVALARIGGGGYA
ncbi:MAG: hypothetical protein ACJAVS_001066 [Paracoccaceae bacterium]